MIERKKLTRLTSDMINDFSFKTKLDQIRDSKLQLSLRLQSDIINDVSLNSKLDRIRDSQLQLSM